MYIKLKKDSLHKIIILCFMLFLSKISISQVFNPDGLNCSSVREGKWIYKEIPNARYSIRQGNKQTSHYPDGATNEFDIKWVNKCEFIMTFVKSSNKDQKIYNKGDELRVTIDEIEGDCYTFTMYSKGRKFPSSQMCRVKE